MSWTSIRDGHVGGTSGGDSRSEDWDEQYPANGNLTLQQLVQLQDASARIFQDHSGDITGVLDDIIGNVLRFAVGVFPAPVFGLPLPMLIFIGGAAGSLIGTGEVGPGLRIVGDWLWLAGPEGSLYAIAAEWIAGIGERTERLSQQAYDWANAEVYAGTLPPREKLLLTDTIGASNRQFVWPRWDGKITLNMGGDLYDKLTSDTWRNQAFSNPADPAYIDDLHTFIHELGHTWQIQNRANELAFLADGFVTQIGNTLSGGEAYKYGPPGAAWSSYGLEGQPQLVADWWAGTSQNLSVAYGMKDTTNPYYRYIIGNIQVGAA